ncbi:MAG: MarR family transcriptional regulator [Actinobacteria bacterium]|nr:MarR family transcriptional regulator [Actinomycetota bacterium]
MGRTVARLGRHVEIALARVDLTIAQYRALTQLSEGAEASSSLAAKLAVSRPSATAVVEGLVERGLVDRRHSVEDRRRVSVNLTDAGWRVLSAADEAVGAKLAEVLTVVGARQAAHAVNGIMQWGRAMDANRARKRAGAGTGKPAGAA